MPCTSTYTCFAADCYQMRKLPHPSHSQLPC